MGMRRNIKLEYKVTNNGVIVKEFPIFFYTHWDALNLGHTLKNALIRGKSRWHDEPYLGRIIFSEMIQKEVLDLTGYGISPFEQDPEYPTIIVDMNANKVNGIPFEEFIAMDVDNFGLDEK